LSHTPLFHSVTSMLRAVFSLLKTRTPFVTQSACPKERANELARCNANRTKRQYCICTHVLGERQIKPSWGPSSQVGPATSGASQIVLGIRGGGGGWGGGSAAGGRVNRGCFASRRGTTMPVPVSSGGLAWTYICSFLRRTYKINKFQGPATACKVKHDFPQIIDCVRGPLEDPFLRSVVEKL
jgi:hypothetical protein